MTALHTTWLAQQHARWMRSDATRWLRQDCHRYQRPQHPDEVKYSADQPRVPAGNPDGGQWTSGGGLGSSDARVANNDKPRLGRAAAYSALAQAAERVIRAYRSENVLNDLFGNKQGTVGFTEMDGKLIFGSSSSLPSYSVDDRVAAEEMRNVLIERYHSTMNSSNIGEKPNDALFHAEATVLLRAARLSGGTLQGRELDVYVDRPMCQSCDTVLPLLSRELGNPTVTFFTREGRRIKILRNGIWDR